jgi:DNA-binding transcriptional LysR family regulator
LPRLLRHRPFLDPDQRLAVCAVEEIDPAGASGLGDPLARLAIDNGVEGQDVGVLGAETWRLADLGAKHALLLAGSGWGLMPEPVVRDDLASARLVRLDLPEARGGFYPLQAIYRRDDPPGPAATWMIQRFVSQAA